jgi:hypothetical protein
MAWLFCFLSLGDVLAMSLIPCLFLPNGLGTSTAEQGNDSHDNWSLTFQHFEALWYHLRCFLGAVVFSPKLKESWTQECNLSASRDRPAFTNSQVKIERRHLHSENIGHIFLYFHISQFYTSHSLSLHSSLLLLLFRVFDSSQLPLSCHSYRGSAPTADFVFPTIPKTTLR